MVTIEKLLKQQSRLAGISDSATLDVELLLCFCLKKPRSYLRAWPDVAVQDSAIKEFERLLLQREQGKPIAYLIEEQGFWTLNLSVNESTLIPRPETELLVETALELLSDKPSAKVLDLGTGTGAIALALASERPQWQVLACDKEPVAVELASYNQQNNKISNVSIFQSDWFSNIEPQLFDLIVSNPPYIDSDDPHLMQGDVMYEPRSALVADNHGLADIEKILQNACSFLSQGAWLAFEHGYDQAESVHDLLLQYHFKNVFCYKDLAGHDRVSGGQYCR